MSGPAKNPLKSIAWFGEPRQQKVHAGMLSLLGQYAVSLVAGWVFWKAQHTVTAEVIWLIGTILLIVCTAWPVARKGIEHGLAVVGRIAGTVIGGLLLGILYLFAFTPSRIGRRLTGVDELHLRDGWRTSFWLACDLDAHKVRYVSSMFATEVPVHRGRPLLSIAVAIVGLVVISEGVLRIMHYGEPVTYVADPVVGYYPKPNTEVRRSGGIIHINQYGMRSNDIDAKKAPGVFRILLIGDSTLYGGSYVDQKDLYSSRLEQQLNVRAGGKVEILAMGTNGWGPFHERGYVSKFGTFDADIAFINLPIDDVNRPLYGLVDVPFFAEQNPPRLALEEVVNHFIWRYRADHAGLTPKWEAEQSEIGIREYGKLVDDLKQRGCEVMLAVLPTRGPGFGGDEYPLDSQWRAKLEKTVIEHGAKPYFAKGWFKGKGKADQIYHDDVHLMPRGHHAYANFLEKRIVEDSPQFREFLAKHEAVAKGDK